MRERLETWLATPIPGLPIAASPANVEQAKAFVLRQWQARAAERQCPLPHDIEGACKFASLFAVKLFGGEMRGNWHHQYVMVGAKIVDLTDGAGVRPALRYEHDPSFWFNTEHLDSLLSCLERVDKWLGEWTRSRHAAASNPS